MGVTITAFIKPESQTLNINCSINFLCFDKNQQTQTYKRRKIQAEKPHLLESDRQSAAAE